MQDIAEMEMISTEIASEVIGTRRINEMYDWLLEGTTASESTLEENESESFVSRLSELYQVRVAWGLEESSAYSSAAEFELPRIEMCDEQTIVAARNYSQFMREYNLKWAFMQDLLVFTKKVEAWI